MNPKQLLQEAFKDSLNAVSAEACMQNCLPEKPKGRLVIVGAGKAAAAMAKVAEDHYDEVEGLVITRYGHGLETKKIEVVEAAHPVPDEAGLKATERILELAHSLTQDDLLLCLISGGGSALMTAPKGLSLDQKASLTQALLKSGADIREMNAVRKHLSHIKGGQLAAAAYPAKVVSLIISDVTGDDLSTIASGPTVPDETTFQDALDILARYKIQHPELQNFFKQGKEGHVNETPKVDSPVFKNVENHIIANAQEMLERCVKFFEQQDITALILSESLTGESREAAKFHAALARQIVQYGQPVRRPCVLLSGGETTVTVRGSGRGGRNSEFLLSLALELDGLNNVYALAADTDGIDGSEDNAGGIVSPESLEKIGKAKARTMLDNNDGYGFLEQTNSLLVTGATRTNVNDLRMLLIL